MKDTDSLTTSPSGVAGRRLALAALASTALLASSVTAGAQDTQPSSGTDTTLDRVLRSKVLRIAALPGELPYFNKDLASGEWSGFAMNMARDLATVLDAKLQLTESTYATSILELQSGRIDIAFALASTPARALAIDFTSPMLPHPYGAIMKPGLEAKTWSDLNRPGIRVAVDVGTSQEAVARRFLPNASIKGLKTRDEAMLEQISGRADAVITTLIIGLSAVRKAPQLGRFAILQGPAITIPTCVGIRKETDTRWLRFLNSWMDYNRGIGQTREWFYKGLALNGVKPEDVPADLVV